MAYGKLGGSAAVGAPISPYHVNAKSPSIPHNNLRSIHITPNPNHLRSTIFTTASVSSARSETLEPRLSALPLQSEKSNTDRKGSSAWLYRHSRNIHLHLSSYSTSILHLPSLFTIPSSTHALSSTHAGHATPVYQSSSPNLSSLEQQRQPRRRLPLLTYASLFLLAVSVAIMALPPFLARLFRPFTHSARLSIAPDSSAAAAAPIPDGAQRCTVAAGCFWGTEHLYRKHFGGKGLLDCKVGYIGGDLDNPSYRAVCGGKTGHAEAAQIIFDPSQISYRQLLEFFYRMHDPTTLNRQGPDTGPQYRSAIYFYNEEQEKIAQEVTRQANEKWWKSGVVTEIAPAGKWWSAEEYHQLYLDKNPSGYECPSHFLRSFPPLE